MAAKDCLDQRRPQDRPQRIDPKLLGANTYEPTTELFNQHSSQALIESGIGASSAQHVTIESNDVSAPGATISTTGPDSPARPHPPVRILQCASPSKLSSAAASISTASAEPTATKAAPEAPIHAIHCPSNPPAHFPAPSAMPQHLQDQRMDQCQAQWATTSHAAVRLNRHNSTREQRRAQQDAQRAAKSEASTKPPPLSTPLPPPKAPPTATSNQHVQPLPTHPWTADEWRILHCAFDPNDEEYGCIFDDGGRIHDLARDLFVQSPHRGKGASFCAGVICLDDQCIAELLKSLATLVPQMLPPQLLAPTAAVQQPSELSPLAPPMPEAQSTALGSSTESCTQTDLSVPVSPLASSLQPEPLPSAPLTAHIPTEPVARRKRGGSRRSRPSTNGSKAVAPSLAPPQPVSLQPARRTRGGRLRRRRTTSTDSEAVASGQSHCPPVEQLPSTPAPSLPSPQHAPRPSRPRAALVPSPSLAPTPSVPSLQPPESSEPRSISQPHLLAPRSTLQPLAPSALGSVSQPPPLASRSILLLPTLQVLLPSPTPHHPQTCAPTSLQHAPTPQTSPIAEMVVTSTETFLTATNFAVLDELACIPSSPTTHRAATHIAAAARRLIARSSVATCRADSEMDTFLSNAEALLVATEPSPIHGAATLITSCARRFLARLSVATRRADSEMDSFFSTAETTLEATELATTHHVPAKDDLAGAAGTTKTMANGQTGATDEGATTVTTNASGTSTCRI
jgi:hypothetical protein